MSRRIRHRSEHELADALLHVADRMATALERIADRPDRELIAQEVIDRIAPRPHPKTKPNKRRDKNT